MKRLIGSAMEEKIESFESPREHIQHLLDLALADHTSVDIETLKANVVSGDNILKRMEALRTQDGHNVVRDYLPTPNLGKDEHNKYRR